MKYLFLLLLLNSCVDNEVKEVKITSCTTKSMYMCINNINETTILCDTKEECERLCLTKLKK